MYICSDLMTSTFNVEGELTIIRLCTLLLKSGQWFSALPLPDDRWELTVKLENERRVRSWCETEHVNHRNG